MPLSVITEATNKASRLSFIRFIKRYIEAIKIFQANTSKSHTNFTNKLGLHVSTGVRIKLNNRCAIPVAS